MDGFFFGACEGLTFLGLLSFFLSPGLSRIGVDAGLLRGSYSGPNLLGSGTVMAKVMPTARAGGATNQPFVWLRYGGLWSDAEIIVYYYRVSNPF